MKLRYITPESEALQLQLSYCLLEDSLLNTYSGEDAGFVEGEW